MAQTALEKLQDELLKIARQKARALGLAQYNSQVKIKLHIDVQAYSEEICDADWNRLFALDLSEWERGILEQLKATNNTPFEPPEEEDRWIKLRELKYLIRNRVDPLFIGEAGGLIRIRKRLLRNQRRRR